MAILNFDASTVEPIENDFAPLPVGDYSALISASEIKETKNNPKNSYLKFTFDILEGQYKGRKIFENLNLWRDGTGAKDAETMKFAQSNLSKLCRAVGMMSIGNSEELHGKPMKIHVKVTPASGDYGEGNTITSYKSINGGTTLPTTAPTTAPAQTQTAPKPPAMPWDN